MYGINEKGGVKVIKVKDQAYVITFVRPIPEDYVNVNAEIVFDDRNEKFVKEVLIKDGDVQYTVDTFLNSLIKRGIRLEDVVWSYEVYLEVTPEKRVKLSIQIPSVLPLIGNVTTTGIIISNDPDMKMRVRNFTTVQIDKTIKVIKRSEKYLKIPLILSELEKLLNYINT
ncbi:hypothetical protein WIW90_07470 [Sulfolobaceae archaeon RB850M]